MDARKARYQIDGIAGQRLLMLADRLAADLFYKVAGETEPDRAGDVGGAGLEAVRRVLKVGMVDLDIEDRATAGLPGRHRFEHVPARPEHADPGRAIGLMSGKDVEITAKRADVDRHPRHRLTAV